MRCAGSATAAQDWKLRRVVARHPKSVRVIYIRSGQPDRPHRSAKPADRARRRDRHGALIPAPDSVFAASHAAAEG
jgi:hypothetical protein